MFSYFQVNLLQKLKLCALQKQTLLIFQQIFLKKNLSRQTSVFKKGYLTLPRWIIFGRFCALLIKTGCGALALGPDICISG